MRTAERTSSGPRSVLRRVAGPLVAYHVLILAGAYLIVLGYEGGSRAFEFVGAALVGAGILTELWVLVWSARSTREAAEVEFFGSPRKIDLPSRRSAVGSVCLRCGHEEPGVRWTCSRCGAPSVRTPDGHGEPGPPLDDRAP